MRGTHAFVLATAIVATGLGVSAIRAEQKSSSLTLVVVYKPPT